MTPANGLEAYFAALQDRLQASIKVAAVLDHPGAKGDETEISWERLLDGHLPRRYQVVPKCMFVDHTGKLSQEVDLALCDRQYSTLALESQSRTVVPAEAAYAVFEVKPELNRENVLYAAEKAASVRVLARTSAPITDARGVIEEPRRPSPIIAGLLTTRAGWSPTLGDAFSAALKDQNSNGLLNLGCVLGEIGWEVKYENNIPRWAASTPSRALVFFYLRLLSALQRVGTVPAMDYDQWSAFLSHD
ncbi:MAG: hypothetical protein B7C54_10420 [Acidimicrobiales bacterium mtb01]|nr:hypothetical protein [Actinomycetota bacterium]TEX45487.1 MAG: hypothetical protein B7C54_10420 [Acidimicrobiales bacterium mtb01]